MLGERGKRLVIDTLERAGVRLDGDRPFDLVVKDDAFYPMVLFDGLTGARDAYVLGYCDTEQLDEMTNRLFRGGLSLPFANRGLLAAREVANRLFNMQGGARGLAVQRHYDLGNDVFEAMLDPLLNLRNPLVFHTNHGPSPDSMRGEDPDIDQGLLQIRAFCG